MMSLLQQLCREEGCVPHAYQDRLGFWTIGVGRLIDERKGGGLSPEEIDYLLRNDVERVTRQVMAALPWASGISEPRQAVLIGMAYQMGLAGLLGFRQTLAAVEGGRYAAAGGMMLQSLWAQQTPERALRMAKQMGSDEWQA